MADVSVRPGGPADADRVATVQVLTWTTAFDFLPPPPAEADVAAGWRAALADPPVGARMLVALERDLVVGYAALEGPELTALLVEPRWGRRGHGSRLLAAAVEGWQAEGVDLLTTWVWVRDKVTPPFLTAAGWAPDGTVRGLDTGPRVEEQRRWHTRLEG